MTDQELEEIEAYTLKNSIHFFQNERDIHSKLIAEVRELRELVNKHVRSAEVNIICTCRNHPVDCPAYTPPEIDLARK